ncbi:MAG: phosphoenolpyruvate--protein phosphotransferase [Lentisphaerae bacterium RIFOXYB12_FULL_65_16]|nr:MAG: phosphoenolpyruvate--protein phosphotransferase [Lentisphaerae bacterium RIFOXYA12_64_32]OGV92560.1 MAG: phosphoenolpyruvate--protein phosphotransferase [Lentisphaerae bacterium RIFOXYB12_FULL_65_16]
MPTKELNIIRQISEIIAGTPNYREALRLTVQCIAEKMGVDACTIWVHEEVPDQLVIEATHGLPQDVVRRVRFSARQGITGLSFSTGETVNTSDMRIHPANAPLPTPGASAHSALLAVPLTVAGRRIGVLDLACVKSKAFGPRTVETVQAIASRLAVFVLNARMARDADRTFRLAPPAKVGQLILKGKAVTPGVVRGTAHLLPGAEVLEAGEMETVRDPVRERELLERALSLARQEAAQLHAEASELVAEADAAIFQTHVLLLDDPTLIQRLRSGLEKGYRLRSALRAAAEEYRKEMGRLTNEFMRERLADVKDVILRIYEAAERVEGLRGGGIREMRAMLKGKFVIVARELLPSQLIRVPLGNLAGVVCEQGGATSHVAILAKALRLPMLVGVAGATEEIRANDDLILDCTTGFCYVRPEPTVVRNFKGALAHIRAGTDEVTVVPPTPGMTSDGTPIRLAGNISLISEMSLLLQSGAMGIGLYRTEFMFMMRATYPTEEEQYGVFHRVAQAVGDQSVTIRVLDVGGDKPLSYVDFGPSENSFMGWRGIRFLLDSPQYFEPHLRAMLRTTAHGDARLLLPTVADLDELLRTKEILARLQAAMDRSGVPYRRDYKLGIMLEVPSAVWALPDLLPHVDFVSLGTNDLVQHTFALDRGNSKVMHWYRQFHPVLLRLIHQTCKTVGAVPGKEVSLCGEIAANPRGTPLLVGLGLRSLSMSPWIIPTVRETIGRFSLAECQALATQALACARDADVNAVLDDFGRAHNLESPKAEA